MPSVFRSLAFVMLVGVSTGCLDQYKPFSYWKQLETERVSAQNYGVLVTAQGDRKYLAEDGTLVIESSGAQLEDPKLTESAQDIYGNFCATCHAKDGSGIAAMNARDFTDPVWQSQVSDEEIALIIDVGTMAIKSGQYPDELAKIQKRPGFAGLTGGMAPSGGRVPALTAEQRAEMVKVIRAFAKK